MATTRRDRVGRVRERLARLLEEAIPTATFDPARLNSNVPVYATPQWDCCSWDGWGKDRETGMNVHVTSWDTMTECVRWGIGVTSETRFSHEVSRNSEPKKEPRP